MTNKKKIRNCASSLAATLAVTVPIFARGRNSVREKGSKDSQFLVN